MSSPAYRRYQKKEQKKKEKKQIRKEKREFSRYRIPSEQDGIQEPTLEIALAMGETFSEMDNEPLMVIAEMGSFSAREEVLRRNIMAADKVNYKEAGKTLEEIKKKCECNLFFYAVPYKIGIIGGLISAVGIFPMTYDRGTATRFSKYAELHGLHEDPCLETMFEVGNWTNSAWLGPLTATLSFSMLALQYVRHQMLNIGIKPVTARMHRLRTASLREQYPNYNERLLKNYVEAFPLSEDRIFLPSLFGICALVGVAPFHFIH